MAKDIVIKTKKFIANKLLNRKQFVSIKIRRNMPCELAPFFSCADRNKKDSSENLRYPGIFFSPWFHLEFKVRLSKTTGDHRQKRHLMRRVSLQG